MFIYPQLNDLTLAYVVFLCFTKVQGSRIKPADLRKDLPVYMYRNIVSVN